MGMIAGREAAARARPRAASARGPLVGGCRGRFQPFEGAQWRSPGRGAPRGAATAPATVENTLVPRPNSRADVTASHGRSAASRRSRPEAAVARALSNAAVSFPATCMPRGVEIEEEAEHEEEGSRDQRGEGGVDGNPAPRDCAREGVGGVSSAGSTNVPRVDQRRRGALHRVRVARSDRPAVRDEDRERHDEDQKRQPAGRCGRRHLTGEARRAKPRRMRWGRASGRRRWNSSTARS